MLKRGEIHVQVAVDKIRPLTVLAGDRIIQATGTAFSVDITDDKQIELVVTEGRVLVGVRENSSKSVDLPILAAGALTVEAGEEIAFGSAKGKVMKVTSEEIEVKLSWRKGNIIFRGESLEDAVKEIGRYTTVEFVILDDSLKTVRIAGLFRAGDVEGLLATLRENFDIVNSRSNDGKILLTSR
jgi:transmembrane sensor